MDATTPGTMLIDRSVLRISGDDPRGFLNGLVTSDVASLAEDAPLWAGLLTPQGKALFDFILWTDGEAVLVDVEASAAEALARRFAMYRLRRAITIEPTNLAVHWSPTDGGIADPRLPELGWRWLGEPAAEAQGWREHRLRHGVTEGVSELGSGETLWLECNAAELNGVSFAKGCYVGQENTARMHYRSRVNRRLVVVPAASPADANRAIYPELGLAVAHRRVEAIGDAIVPSWLEAALAQRPTAE